MKGIFNIKPSIPRYSKVWDISIVLKFLEKRSPGKCLNLLQITQKLVTLIALITGQCSQTLQVLDINHLEFAISCVKFHIPTLFKYNSPVNNILNVITSKSNQLLPATKSFVQSPIWTILKKN